MINSFYRFSTILIVGIKHAIIKLLILLCKIFKELEMKKIEAIIKPF